ncbi:MAG: hypothetical protein GY731_17580 [Gammaproteobacteria bacterium]|nr:hypothetical protein [Gammaproteobacteria bacterium]
MRVANKTTLHRGGFNWRAGMEGKTPAPVILMLVAVALGGWLLFAQKPSETPTPHGDTDFPDVGQQAKPMTLPQKSWQSAIGTQAPSQGLKPGAEQAVTEAGISSPSIPVQGPAKADDAAESRVAKLASTPDPAVSSVGVTDSDAARGDRARTIIAQMRQQEAVIDLNDIHAKAERFRGAGLLADAHIMYHFAARNGHTPSAMVLGTMYDPSYHSNITSIMDEPDIGQAHQWYLLAASSGDMVAKEHLNDLRKLAERAASTGDPDARRLLLQWR